MRIAILFAAAAACFALALPLSVHAFETRAGDAVYIGAGETIDGSLYAAGNSLVIDGRIDGDVIAAGQNITVNGEVSGDVIAAGQNITVNGKVGGNVRVAGNTVNIGASVARNLNAFCGTLNIAAGSAVGSDALVAAGSAVIRGEVGRDLHGAAGSAVIAGPVGRDVHLTLEGGAPRDKDRAVSTGPKLTLEPGAQIGGSLRYRAFDEARIEDGAKVASGSERLEPRTYESSDRDKDATRIWWRIWSLFAALVVGLMLTSLLRERTIAAADALIERTWPAIGWGAVILFAGPFMLLALALTLIGIPLALILLALWLVAIYVAKIVAGIMVGRSLFDRLGRGKKEDLVWPMIAGLAATWILFSLPVLGGAFSFLATVWGLGGIWIAVRNK